MELGMRYGYRGLPRISYDDYWGYTLGNAGYPIQCELNGDTCYGDYDGTYYLTNYSGLEYAYSGDSSTGAFGTFYVDALAIDISPGYYTLDGGEQVTFTAGASNAGNFLPFYQWTLVSGPAAVLLRVVRPELHLYCSFAGHIGKHDGDDQGLYHEPDLLSRVSNRNHRSAFGNDQRGHSEYERARKWFDRLYTANITNGAENATATWTSSLGVSMPSGLSTTYTAPAASATIFPSSNTATDTITSTVQGSSPAVSAATSLTLVEPVTITNVSPASWTAGTANIPVTDYRDRVQRKRSGNDQQPELAFDDLHVYSNRISDYDPVQCHHPRQSFQYACVARCNHFGEHDNQRAYQLVHVCHHDQHRAHCLHLQHQPLNEHIFPDVWLFVNDHSRHYMQGG